MHYYKWAIAIIIFLNGQFLFAEEIQFKIYDKRLKKKVLIVLDTYSGHYKLPIAEYFSPSMNVSERYAKGCRSYGRFLKDNRHLKRESLTNQNLPIISWEFFEKLNPVNYLDSKVQRELKKRGLDGLKVANKSEVLLSGIKIKGMDWDHSALALFRDNILGWAETELVNTLHASMKKMKPQSGTLKRAIFLHPLYCDLLGHKVRINFEIFFSESPLSIENPSDFGRFNKESILDLNRLLVEKISHIKKMSSGHKSEKHLFSPRFTASIAAFSGLLMKEGIEIRNLKHGEFIQLVRQFIDKKTGLPRALTGREGEELAQKLAHLKLNRSTEKKYKATGYFK